MKSLKMSLMLPGISLLLFPSAPTFANPLGMLFSKKEDRARIELSPRSDLHVLEEKKNSDDNWYYHWNAKANVNFYKGERTTWFFSAAGEEQDLGRDPIYVGENNTPVEGKLFNHSLGLGFRKNLEDQGSWMASIDYGSASDKPFRNSRDTTLSGNLAYVLAPQEKSQWIFFLNYSNNRAFWNNIPLPSFAYVYRKTEKLSMTFGVPFLAINYIDSPHRMVNFFITPASASLDAGYGVKGPLQIFGLLQYKASAYMHHQRSEKVERLLLEDKTVEAGLRSPLAKWFLLSLSSGLSFDRFYYEGEGLFEGTGDKQRLPNDLFVRGKLTFLIR